jgi:hypothetical protein
VGMARTDRWRGKEQGQGKSWGGDEQHSGSGAEAGGGRGQDHVEGSSSWATVAMVEGGRGWSKGLGRIRGGGVGIREQGLGAKDRGGSMELGRGQTGCGREQGTGAGAKVAGKIEEMGRE